MTVLKKVCRRHGIPRWPHRKLKAIEKTIESLEISAQKNPVDAIRIFSEIEELKRKRMEILQNPSSISVLSPPVARSQESTSQQTNNSNSDNFRSTHSGSDPVISSSTTDDSHTPSAPTSPFRETSGSGSGTLCNQSNSRQLFPNMILSPPTQQSESLMNLSTDSKSQTNSPFAHLPSPTTNLSNSFQQRLNLSSPPNNFSLLPPSHLQTRPKNVHNPPDEDALLLLSIAGPPAPSQHYSFHANLDNFLSRNSSPPKNLSLQSPPNSSHHFQEYAGFSIPQQLSHVSPLGSVTPDIPSGHKRSRDMLSNSVHSMTSTLNSHRQRNAPVIPSIDSFCPDVWQQQPEFMHRKTKRKA
jgi:hypothetical protein